MRQRASFNPVLVELTVILLFLALSTAALVQLIGKAREISQGSEAGSRALILLEDALERTKADPEGGGAFDSAGVRQVNFSDDGYDVRGTVKRTLSVSGAYYEIALAAYDGGKELLALSAGRYVPGEAAGG